MAFYNKHQSKSFHGTQKNTHQPRQNTSHTFQTKQIVPLPPRVYRDDEIHVDIVDLSFNDIRRVETGKYPDETVIVEYLSEKQATDRGYIEQWQKAQPIEEYRKSDRD